MEVDRKRLATLVQAAIDARLDFDRKLRGIEEFLGQDIDDLDGYIDGIAGTSNGSDDDALDGLLELL